MAKVIEKNKRNNGSYGGTPLYRAPEQEKQSYWNQKTDVWSFGVIVAALVGLYPKVSNPPNYAILLQMFKNIRG